MTNNLHEVPGAAPELAQHMSGTPPGAVRLSGLLEAALEEMEGRASGLLQPIKTPWPGLNRVLGGGLWRGLHVLTGTTGSGKTQFALQIALAAGFQGIPVLYVTLEMPANEIVARTMALLLSETERRLVMWSDLALGRSAELVRVLREKGPALIRELPFCVEEANGGEWNAVDLAASARGMRDWSHSLLAAEIARNTGGMVPASDVRANVVDGTGRWPLVVVDYQQLVGPSENDRAGDLRSSIRNAVIKAKNLSKEGATVLLLSSVSRENAKLLVPGDDQVAPGLGDGKDDPGSLVGLGKESGEIEFSADSVMCMSRGERGPVATPVHLAIGKVRAGVPGWVELLFNGSHFTEVMAASSTAAQNGQMRRRSGYVPESDEEG